MSFIETFYGYIETTTDTLLVFEACRRGILPKITRRLQEKERGLIRSGTVLVFDERESGIKRWTDGLVWSPSRILGNFLVYRELNGRNNTLIAKRNDTNERDIFDTSYQRQHGQYPYPFNQQQDSLDQANRYRERALVGSLTTSYSFKPSGLIKKTMSIVVNGSHLHLISYYNKNDVLNNTLPTPSTVPQLAHLHISADMIQRQSFRVSPMLESSMTQLYPNNAFAETHVKSLPSPTSSHCATSPNNMVNYMAATVGQRRRRSSSPNSMNMMPARKVSRILTDVSSLQSSTSSLSSPHEQQQQQQQQQQQPIFGGAPSNAATDYLIYGPNATSDSYQIPQQDLKTRTSFLPTIDTSSNIPSAHSTMIQDSLTNVDYHQAPPSPKPSTDIGQQQHSSNHYHQYQQHTGNPLDSSLTYFTPSPLSIRPSDQHCQEQQHRHQIQKHHPSPPLLPPPSTPSTTTTASSSSSSNYMTNSPSPSPPALDRHLYHPSVRHVSMTHPSTNMYPTSSFTTPF